MVECQTHSSSGLNEICGERVYLLLRASIELYLGMRVHYHIEISSYRECKFARIAKLYLQWNVYRGNVELTLFNMLVAV